MIAPCSKKGKQPFPGDYYYYTSSILARMDDKGQQLHALSLNVHIAARQGLLSFYKTSFLLKLKIKTEK